MNIEDLLNILEYLQHECNNVSGDLILRDEYMESMKYYGGFKAYQNVIHIIKDKEYRNSIIAEMIKKKTETPNDNKETN